jgi:hypothetical protein
MTEGGEKAGREVSSPTTEKVAADTSALEGKTARSLNNPSPAVAGSGLKINTG